MAHKNSDLRAPMLPIFCIKYIKISSTLEWITVAYFKAIEAIRNPHQIKKNNENVINESI